jgi:hypothetical protein
MDRPRDEQFKGYVIKINQVPDAKFDVGDIGRAYLIYRDTAQLFRFVVKTTSGRQTDEKACTSVLDWGREKVKSMIEEESFTVGEDYCWKWARLLGELPEPIPCEVFVRRG